MCIYLLYIITEIKLADYSELTKRYRYIRKLLVQFFKKEKNVFCSFNNSRMTSIL